MCQKNSLKGQLTERYLTNGEKVLYFCGENVQYSYSTSGRLSLRQQGVFRRKKASEVISVKCPLVSRLLVPVQGKNENSWLGKQKFYEIIILIIRNVRNILTKQIIIIFIFTFSPNFPILRVYRAIALVHYLFTNPSNILTAHYLPNFGLIYLLISLT